MDDTNVLVSSYSFKICHWGEEWVGEGKGHCPVEEKKHYFFLLSTQTIASKDVHAIYIST